MRRQGLCDSSFESYNYVDSKNIEDKSWRPRGGTLERFENRSIAPPNARKA